MDETRRQTLEALLRKMHPDAIQSSLISSALFITGWELLKNEVIDGVRGFHVTGFDAHGPTRSPSYEAKVRCLHKKEFDACLLWLVSTEALTEAQAERVRAVRKHRNAVAHELPRFLVNPGTDVDLALLIEMRELIAVLGRFWGSIEVAISPDFDGVEVAEDQIVSGTQMLMDYLIDAVSNSSATLRTHQVEQDAVG